MKLFVTYSGKSTVHEDVLNEYFFGFFLSAIDVVLNIAELQSTTK